MTHNMSFDTQVYRVVRKTIDMVMKGATFSFGIIWAININNFFPKKTMATEIMEKNNFWKNKAVNKLFHFWPEVKMTI